MVNQQKISSGFDVEFLMGEEYLKYFLLCSMETGTIPWATESEETDRAGHHIRTDAQVIHPPEALNLKRLYPVHPDFLGHENPYIDLGIAAYSGRPDEFEVTFLQDSPIGADVRVLLYPSILLGVDDIDHAIIPFDNNKQLYLDFKFSLDTREQNGLLGDIGLKIEVLDISGELITIAEEFTDQNGNHVFSKADALATLKKQFDRVVDFSVAGGGTVAGIALKKFFADDESPNAIGIYVNLALQSGPAPTDLLPADRGDLEAAQNFLPLTSRMAFGFPAATYQKLSDDLFYKMAELKEGSTDEYEYPLKEGDEVRGRIKNFRVYPDVVSGTDAADGSHTTHYTNVLVIDMHGEYIVDNMFDPDFHVVIRLTPVENNGLLDFDVDVDVHVSALAQLIAYIVETAITFVAPKLGLPLLFSTVILVKLIEKFGKDFAVTIVDDQLRKTSFLDTLPHKLTVEKRRWDPLYSTIHRLEAAVDDLAVNDEGFAFSANDVFIGKRFEPFQKMAIRAATRNAEGRVDGLVYQARDLSPYLETDLKFIFPAVARMPYEALLLPEGDIESYRVLLTLDQVDARMASEDKGVNDKHLKNILYIPKKVHVIEHQIYKILSVSETEVAEITGITQSLLRTELRAQNGAAYREQARNELEAELGRSPNDAELADRVTSIVNKAADGLLYARLPSEIDKRLTFGLEPFEFAELQKKKLLILGQDHLVIRKLHRGGKVTVYYRDYEQPYEPHVNPWDNLLALPRYIS